MLGSSDSSAKVGSVRFPKLLAGDLRPSPFSLGRSGKTPRVYLLPTSLTRIAPLTGTAFFLRRGELLTVVDVCGEQPATLVAFDADSADWLSSGRTIENARTIAITRGHTLASNTAKPMLTVVVDTVGTHDFLMTPCADCLTSLTAALEPFGIPSYAIPTSFNIFANLQIGAGGSVTIARPRSSEGDRLVLRAETDLVVALTACATLAASSYYGCKPIDFAITKPSQR